MLKRLTQKVYTAHLWMRASSSWWLLILNKSWHTDWSVELLGRFFCWPRVLLLFCWLLRLPPAKFLFPPVWLLLLLPMLVLLGWLKFPLFRTLFCWGWGPLRLGRLFDGPSLYPGPPGLFPVGPVLNGRCTPRGGGLSYWTGLFTHDQLENMNINMYNKYLDAAYAGIGL